MLRDRRLESLERLDAFIYYAYGILTSLQGLPGAFRYLWPTFRQTWPEERHVRQNYVQDIDTVEYREHGISLVLELSRQPSVTQVSGVVLCCNPAHANLSISSSLRACSSPTLFR